MIICDAVGGLNNRLRCLVSCMRIDNNVKLVWPVKTSNVWLWCSFKDLFRNDFEEFQNKNECVKKYPDLKVYSDFKFIKLNNEIDINHMIGDDVPKDIKLSVVEQINKLKPVEYIDTKVNLFKQKFNKKTITVSVRTYKDAKRNYNSNGIFFDISKIFDAMDEHTESNFFVTCDHQDTFKEIFERYPDRIIYTPKRTFFGDYKSVAGIQDSVIDLLLGGLNNHIIGTQGSSFCDMQWWFGGAKASVNYINAHPGRG